jgi:RHS repeat-associated protein
MSEFSTTSGASGAASSDRLQYRVGEQTGTAVMLLDSGGGNPRENNRVFPFGEPWLQFAGSNNTEKFTYQHDNDVGTDLDYAMARYYASRSGRFMTPDPGHIGANPNDSASWNAYVYVDNDPINHVDDNGKWKRRNHNSIIDDAFPFLTENQRKTLKRISAHQDDPVYGGFNASNSHQHAMCMKGEQVEQGIMKFKNYVKEQQGLAVQYQQGLFSYRPQPSSSLNTFALAAFGRALHAEMDNLSPAHVGCQVFYWGEFKRHSDQDSRITLEQRSQAVQRARDLFLETFSYPGELWGINGMNQFDLLELFWKQYEHVEVEIRFVGPVE